MRPLLLWLWACGGPEPVDPAEPPPSDPAVDTSMSPTSTGDTASPPSTCYTGIPPSVRIRGRIDSPYNTDGSGDQLGSRLLCAGDLDGDGFDDLMAAEDDNVVVIPGPLEPGDVLTDDVILSRIAGGTVYMERAGDTDGDGLADVWIGPYLMRGPLVGDLDYAVDHDVEIVGALGGKVAGDFDADGDGELDAVVFGASQNLTVHYGPFTGDVAGVASPDHDPSAALSYGDDGCTTSSGTGYLARDLLGPGRHVGLAVGDGDQCSIGTFLVELTGAPGRALGTFDAFAWSEIDWLRGFEDFDEDGIQDLQGIGSVYGGPFELQIGFDTLVSSTYGGFTTPDLDGDGHRDFLWKEYDDDSEDATWYVVPGGENLYDWTEVPGGIHSAELGGTLLFHNTLEYRLLSSELNVTGCDLDGDGRGDLVVSDKHANRPDLDDLSPSGGEIRVWFAKDIYP